MHRLACVEVEHVADPIAEAERVGRRLRHPGGLEAVELGTRDLERSLVLVAGPRLADLVGDAGAEVGAEALPLASEHPVALQIAEAAVVGHDLEPVPHRLPAATRAVAAVAPLASELADQLGALDRVKRRDPSVYLGFRHAGRLVKRRCQQVVLGAVDVDELDRGGAIAVAAIEPEPGDRPLGRLAALAQVRDPVAAALGALDPRDEARDDALELGEQHVAVLARFGQRRGGEPEQ